MKENRERKCSPFYKSGFFDFCFFNTFDSDTNSFRARFVESDLLIELPNSSTSIELSDL